MNAKRGQQPKVEPKSEHVASQPQCLFLNSPAEVEPQGERNGIIINRAMDDRWQIVHRVVMKGAGVNRCQWGGCARKVENTRRQQ